MERVKQYKDGLRILREWLGSGAEVVDPKLANSRAATCLKCPLNITHSTFPIAENAAMIIREQVGIKNKLDLRVEGEENLHTCQGCGCVMALKVWVPFWRIKPDETELENFDANCWLRTEI